VDENDSASCPVVGFGIDVLNFRLCYQLLSSLHLGGYQLKLRGT
jgi:hypothetical protein